VNNVRQFADDKAAHLFINRRGEILVGHEMSVPWRATKLETNIGEPSEGMFIHVESVQPRRSDPRGGPKNDAVAPKPGFTAAQYERLGGRNKLCGGSDGACGRGNVRQPWSEECLGFGDAASREHLCNDFLRRFDI
jgi:hypothetical protein